MTDVHRRPTHIFTSYLALSSIIIFHSEDLVLLFGVYGHLLTGDTETIEIETDFQTLNDLLSLIEGQADEAIEALFNAITNPTDDHTAIRLDDSGGVHFYHQIFSFIAIYEQNEQGLVIKPKELSYWLAGYLPLGEMLEPFEELLLPEDPEELAAYYNKLLSMQYHFYLHFLKKESTAQALKFSNLTDPTLFALAQSLYQLQKK